MTLVYVMLGGAVGSGLRYLLASVLQQSGEGQFPYGTLAANLLGCFLIGVLTALITNGMQISDNIRLGLMVGVLGGFTTFSSFGLETIQLMQEGRLGAATTYWSVSNAGGLFAIWLGLKL